MLHQKISPLSSSYGIAKTQKSTDVYVYDVLMPVRARCVPEVDVLLLQLLYLLLIFVVDFFDFLREMLLKPDKFDFL